MRVLANLEALVLGVALIVVGGLWMLANLGRLDLLDTLHRWWPSILVFWGALELAAALARKQLRGGSR
jgi:hypothetical protein